MFGLGNGIESNNLMGKGYFSQDKEVCAKKMTAESRPKLWEQSTHIPGRVSDKGKVPKAG